MDDMDNFDLLSAEKVAAKYGGDKRKIGQAAQMGLVNPTVAVMAGMFIDRMRGAAVQEQQPSTTVAQDVMAPATQMAGLGATPQAQAVPQMAPQANTQMAAAPTGTRTLAEGGLSSLPVDEDMFPDEYAGGGIVAFQNEGFVDPMFSAPDMGDPYARERTPSQYEMFTQELTLPELQEYYRSGKVPDRLAGQEPRGLGSRGVPLFGGYTGYDLPKAPSKAKEEVAKPAAAAPATRSQGAEESKGEGRGASKTAAAPTYYAEYLKSLKTKFGVSDTPDAKAREALDKYKEKLNKDLDKAGALGLVTAGLGIAGGKSRYALQNLQGAIPGIEQYSKAMDKIREGEKGILDSEARMEQAADARARGDMATAISLEKDARDFALRERTAAAQVAQANRMGSEAEVIDRYAKAKGISFDQAAREIAEMRGEARDPMKTILAERFRNAQKGGAEKIDIRDLITQYPGVTPTR
jgi:hypothetical protein